MNRCMVVMQNVETRVITTKFVYGPTAAEFREEWFKTAPYPFKIVETYNVEDRHHTLKAQRKSIFAEERPRAFFTTNLKRALSGDFAVNTGEVRDESGCGSRDGSNEGDVTGYDRCGPSSDVGGTQ